MLILQGFAKPASAKSTSNYASYDAIDTYIEKQMQRLNIPGASFAIVEGDQIVHLRGFGQARPGGEAPTPQTPFFIGSTTKSFTALAVMQLVEAGKVDLDAPVQRYLPWFRIADPEASAQITVRHLLNQTSGLPLSPGWQSLADFAKTVDKHHGRLEERTITVSSMLNDYLDWPAVQQVFKMERHFTCASTGKVHQETQYGITSLKVEEADPKTMLAFVRSAWSIENGLHYRRDVTFHEDKTRMTLKTIARSRAIINNLVIALFHTHGFANHAQARRMFDAHPLSALSLISRL